jgi:cytidine deaminase
MASILFCAINSFARSMRARLSSFEIGATFPTNEGKAAIGAGRELASPVSLAATNGPAADAAATAPEIRKKDRLESMLPPGNSQIIFSA